MERSYESKDLTLAMAGSAGMDWDKNLEGNSISSHLFISL